MDSNETAPVAVSGRKKLNPELFWLTTILIFAMAIRTVAVLSRDMIILDETSYVRMAENLLLGSAPWDITGTTSTQYSILYPFVTAAFAVVTRDAVSAGYAVSVLFGSLLILPTYMLGKVMWNKRIATAAAALVAVLPLLVDMGSLIDGQNLYAFWVLCAIFFGYRMQFTKRCMCGMLSGTCLGLAYLSNPSALYYLVVLLGMLVIVGLRQEVAGYANKAAAHFVLLFLVFSVPGIAYMTYQNGNFTVYDSPADELYAAVNQLEPGTPAREQEMMGLKADGAIRYFEIRDGGGFFSSLIDEPGAALEATVRAAYHDYLRSVHSIVPVWLLPLIGLGMFKIVWTRREALKYGYFAVILVPLMVLPVSWGDLRYVLPYLAILMLLVARGWIYLEEWTIDTVDEIKGPGELSASSRQNIRVIIAALVLVPLVGLSLWNVLRTDYDTEYRRAGEWIESRGEEEQRIMSRESSSTYYADGTLVPLPYATLSEILEYGRRNQVEYLIVSRQLVDNVRPQLIGLLDPETAVDGLSLVYEEGIGTEDEVLIYRLEP